MLCFSLTEEFKMVQIVIILLLLPFYSLPVDCKFRSKRQGPDTEQCSSTTNYRIDCGYRGIKEKECKSLNCCFDGSRNGRIFCYWSPSSLQARPLTDCNGKNSLDFTVDIAFILDEGGHQNFGEERHPLRRLLLNSVIFSPDLVRPAIATYYDSFRILLRFSNNMAFHKSQSLEALRDAGRSKSGRADLTAGLEAIIQVFSTSLTRPGVPRIAILYLTSNNNVSIPEVQKQLEMLWSMDIDVIIISTTTQSSELETVFPSNFSKAEPSSLIFTSCRRVKTRIDAQKSSLESLLLSFGDVRLRLNNDSGSYMLLFTNKTVQQEGSIYRLKLHARQPGTFYLMIFRWSNKNLTLENEIEINIQATGIQTVDLISLGVQGIKVQKGDLIGIRTSSRDAPLIIPYDRFTCVGDVGYVQFHRNTNVKLGNNYNFSGPVICRNYSLEVTYAIETAAWITHKSRSLNLDQTTVVKRFTQVPDIRHCQQYCLNELNFPCKAIEYSNNGDKICRIFNQSYVKGISDWDPDENTFDHSIWTVSTGNEMDNENDMDNGNGRDNTKATGNTNGMGKDMTVSEISIIGGSIAVVLVLVILIILMVVCIEKQRKSMSKESDVVSPACHCCCYTAPKEARQDRRKSGLSHMYRGSRKLPHIDEGFEDNQENNVDGTRPKEQIVIANTRGPSLFIIENDIYGPVE